MDLTGRARRGKGRTVPPSARASHRPGGVRSALVGPLPLSGDVAVFGLNGLGLGFGGMLLRRFLLWCAVRMLRR